MKWFYFFLIGFMGYQAFGYSTKKISLEWQNEVYRASQFSASYFNVRKDFFREEGVGAITSPDITKYNGQFQQEFTQFAHLVVDYPIRMKLCHSTKFRGMCMPADTFIFIAVNLFYAEEPKERRYKTYAHEIAHMAYDHGVAHDQLIEAYLKKAKEARLIP